MDGQHMTGGGDGVLSARGEARRGEILGLLYTAQRSRRRRRMAARGVLAVAPMVLVAGLVMLMRAGPAAPSKAGPVAIAPPAPAPVVPVAPESETPDAAPSRIQMVQTSPTLDRWLVSTPPPRPEVFIDDDQLLALMAEAGRPTGLIRTRGRVILTAGDFESRPEGPGSSAPDRREVDKI